MDFDDLLLAEAEQEEEMYDDYMDDIEAEMAIEAEVSTIMVEILPLSPSRYHNVHGMFGLEAMRGPLSVQG